MVTKTPVAAVANPPTSLPIPGPQPKTEGSTRVPQPAPAMPTGTPVPDQRPRSDFVLPDRVTHDMVKTEGTRLARQAMGLKRPQS